ncbi:MAG: GNAT family N-acetyltransferase [Butyrivibrio sp.]|nr:GNAT family N-acetyltransferase [Butyrivibrio sp.]
MEVVIVQDRMEKRKIIEVCNTAFSVGMLRLSNIEDVFNKIDKNAVFIAAYDKNMPVGYVAIYANDYVSKIAYISMIAVLENMQRKHIGSELMNRCIVEATKNNMEYIRLEVHKSNQKAISFYEHYGFEFETECSDKSNYLIKKII